MFPLEAKQIFDIPFKWCYGLKCNSVEDVTFSYSGTQGIDMDKIIQNSIQGKATVIITGDTEIEGRALSPNIFISVTMKRNEQEDAYLVKIKATVSGVATKPLSTSEVPFTGLIPIANRVFVFVDPTSRQEVEKCISTSLAELINMITTPTSTPPTFFILH